MTTLLTDGVVLPINRIMLLINKAMLPINRIKLAIDGAVLPINDVMRLQIRANIAGYKLYHDSYCLCFLINVFVSCIRLNAHGNMRLNMSWPLKSPLLMQVFTPSIESGYVNFIITVKLNDS